MTSLTVFWTGVAARRRLLSEPNRRPWLAVVRGVAGVALLARARVRDVESTTLPLCAGNRSSLPPDTRDERTETGEGCGADIQNATGVKPTMVPVRPLKPPKPNPEVH